MPYKIKRNLVETIKKVIPKDSYIYSFLAKLHRRPLTEFYDSGFHGDKYLIEFANLALGHSEQYIETGVSNGSTLTFVAKKFPIIPKWGCEPDRQSFKFASGKIEGLKNVVLKKQTSPGFLHEITEKNHGLMTKDTFFWLDAHANGFVWPLKQEIEFITSNFIKAYIFIDDFKVPGKPWFGYDSYEDQSCSMDFIESSLSKNHTYTVYYPKYQDKTSTYCKLRGWILIEFGHKVKLEIPPSLSEKIEIAPNSIHAGAL